ncbi:MAG: ABC transporter ATP-binding protein [Gammaproteobacteria bacterium]
MTLRIDRLQAHRDRFSLGPIAITLEAGNCLAVMGANGAGKTTFLETMAGFVQSASGRILLDGRDITHRVPERRHIAYLPQDLALFPHLNVMQNISFAVKRGKQYRRRERIDPLIREFGLESISKRYPHQLSSGQAQRVAFARALAMDPAVLLLDEPTTNLDLAGQRSLNSSLQRFLVERGLIVIYVTHNIIDGVSLASHLIVLEHGKAIQTGTPDVVFHSPADARVAAHLGITNLWPAEVLDKTSSTARVRIGEHEFACAQRSLPNAPFFAGIGPGEIEVSSSVPADRANCLQVVVQRLQVSGRTALLELAGGPAGLRASVLPSRAGNIEVGQTLWVRLPADRLRLIPASSE